MSWSYSGEPSVSDLDEVRFWIQDTDENDQLITDEEIQFLVDTWRPVNDSNIYVAAVAAEVLASRFAREVSYGADGVSMGANELQSKYETLALSLRDQYKASLGSAGGPDVGGILYGEEFDSTVKPLSWGKGMHDNPRGINQDRGGTHEHPPIPEISGTY